MKQVVMAAAVLALSGALAAQEKPPPGARMPVEGGPKVGTPAPDFTLKTLDGKGEVTLSSFRGKQPVVLIFGSYT
jgi:hypothetical protein